MGNLFYSNVAKKQNYDFTTSCTFLYTNMLKERIYTHAIILTMTYDDNIMKEIEHTIAFPKYLAIKLHCFVL